MTVECVRRSFKKFIEGLKTLKTLKKDYIKTRTHIEEEYIIDIDIKKDNKKE